MKKKGAADAKLITIQYECEENAVWAFAYFRGVPTLKKLRTEVKKIQEYQGIGGSMKENLGESPNDLSKETGLTRWFLGPLV